MTRPDPWCDCGTCCDACGHDPDCTSRTAEPIDDDGHQDYLIARG